MFESFSPEDWERYRALINNPNYFKRKVTIPGTPRKQVRDTRFNPLCMKCGEQTKKAGRRRNKTTGVTSQRYRCKDKLCDHNFAIEEMDGNANTPK